MKTHRCASGNQALRPGPGPRGYVGQARALHCAARLEMCEYLGPRKEKEGGSVQDQSFARILLPTTARSTLSP